MSSESEDDTAQFTNEYDRHLAKDSDHGCDFLFRGKEDEHSVDLGEVSHHCTDVPCLLIFALALFGLSEILAYAHANGDMRRVTHGYDFLGNLCGTGDYVKQPVLYWCGNSTNPAALDFKHPVCRDKCPTSSSETYPCFDDFKILDKEKVSGGWFDNIDGTHSFQRTTQFVFRDIQDYNSVPFMHRYCLPNPNDPSAKVLYNALEGYMQTQPGYEILMKVASLKHAWELLLFAAGYAILLGFVYLLLLKCFACILVWTSIGVIIVSCLSMGSYVLYVSCIGPLEGHKWVGLDGMPNTGDAKYDAMIGAAIWLFGFSFLCLACCCQRAIQESIGIVEAACDCMWALPSLLYEPVITLCFKLVAFLGLLFGFVKLLSCGQMTQLSLEQFISLSSSSVIPHGIARSFSYTDTETYMIAAYVFMILWVLEFFDALGQYVLAYMVGKWFYTPNDTNHRKRAPSLLLLRGYGTAIVFHLGTLAFGSFLIALLRFIRMILAFVAKQLENQGNSVGACVAKCCMCCVDCFKNTMEYINKNAYIDVAVHSNHFLAAAWQAMKFIFTAATHIAVLNGATTVAAIGGVGSVTSVVGLTMLEVVKSNKMFSDIESPHYVPEPMVVSIASGVVALTVAYSFMTVFDTVADALLYCYIVAEKRPGVNVHDFAPGRLADLCSSEGEARSYSRMTRRSAA